MRKLLTAFTALVLAAAMCLSPLSPLAAAPAQALTDASVIRVRLSASTDDIDLGVNGVYLLQETGLTISSDVNISISGTSLMVTSGSNVLFVGPECTLVRQSGTLRQYNRSHGWRSYLGDMKYQVMSDGVGGYKLVVTNTVGLEDYLIGVVGYEMSNTWPVEALKAQAVAARTYAISKLSPKASYDIVDTASDQVYKGYDSTITNVITAVKGTQGQVLVNGAGELVRAYYGASNGGRTESTLNAWGTDLPYYTVKADPYDTANDMSSVAKLTLPKVVSAATPIDPSLERYLKQLIAPKLASMGYSGLSDAFSIAGTSSVVSYAPEHAASGCCDTRVQMTFLVSTSGGIGLGAGAGINPPQFLALEGIPEYVLYVNENRLVTPAEQAQILAQYSALYGGAAGNTVSVTVDVAYEDLAAVGLFTNSSLRVYYAQESATSFELVNARFGHGVGMSQRGAQQMANMGMSYLDIINFYYTGLNIAQVSTVSVTDESTTANNNSAEFTVAVAEPSAVRGLLNAKTKLRKGPDSGADALVSLNAGAEVDIVGEHDEWFVVISPSGYVGYVPTESVALQYDDGVVAMSTSSETLLNNPFDGADAMSLINKGDTMQIIASSGEYYLVDTGSFVGFIPKTSVELVIGAIEFDTDTTTRYGYANSAAPMLKSKNSSAVVDTIPAGYVFEIVSQTSDRTYYNIKYNGKSGAIFQSQATVLSKGAVHTNPRQLMEENSIETFGGTKRYVGGTEALNLRASASASAAILDTLARNDRLVVLSTYSGWTKVQTECGLIGYVNSTYLSTSKTEAAAPIDTPDTGTGTGVELNTGVTTEANSYLSSAAATGKIKTSGGALNMRAEPSSSARVVTTIPNGAEVSIVAQNGDYYKIVYNGLTGYAMKSYVTKTAAPALGVIRTGGGALNLRETANTSARVLATIPNGAVVTLVAQNGDFYKVTYNGLTGYAAKQFVVRTETPTESAPATQPEAVEPSAPESVPEPDDSAITGVITTSGGALNLRKKASASAAVVTTIPNGATVELIAQNGDYYKVKYNGQTGYVKKSYVNRNAAGTESTQPAEPVTPSAPESSTKTGVITTSGGALNLREKASASANVLTTVPNGAAVELVAQNGDYYKVNYGGYTGYVLKTYVKRNAAGQTTQPSAPETPAESVKIVATGMIGGSNINLRAAPNTSSAVLGSLQNGTAVGIVAQSGDYYKVTCAGVVGYVKKDYVTGITAAEGAATTTKPIKTQKAKVAANELNVRASASSSGRVLKKIEKGTIVSIVAESGKFYQIKFNGGAGYVSKEYLQLISDANVGGVNASVNFRSGPGKDYPKVEGMNTLSAGQLVEILSVTADGWYQVSADGVIGYVAAQYVMR